MTIHSDALEDLLGADKVSRSPEERERHAHTDSYPDALAPDVVVTPESTEDVLALVRHAAQQRIPVTPFGAGSGLEGNALARSGGISLDMMRMNRVLDIRRDDFLAVVQPGVTHPELNAALDGSGLFFSVDPGADASIGGMVGTNAGGSMGVRYGTMRDNVLALELVTGAGEVIRTGSRAPKSSSGYDLTHLLVGSEGTLGVFTEVTVRLHGRPAALMAATAAFDGIEAAVDAAVAIISSGTPVARLELVDEASVAAVNAFKGLDLPEKPMLFFDFHGNAASVGEDASVVERLCAENGGSGFARASDPAERERLWEARHHVYYAMVARYPGKDLISTDVAVPISALPAAIANAAALREEHGIEAPIVGHVGEGNFHTQMLVQPGDAAELERMTRVNEGIVRHALSLGGTATGEHGVGIRKRKYMEAEHGASLEVMRAIKRVFDPVGILNPGKLIDAEP